MRMPITNIQTIRQWGRVFHYFDVGNPHGLEGLSFAMGRGWRVLSAVDNVKSTTYKCQTIEPSKGADYEVKTLCGVRILTPKDGGEPTLF